MPLLPLENKTCVVCMYYKVRCRFSAVQPGRCGQGLPGVFIQLPDHGDAASQLPHHGHRGQRRRTGRDRERLCGSSQHQLGYVSVGLSVDVEESRWPCRQCASACDRKS
jgi:hypothetical protein